MVYVVIIMTALMAICSLAVDLGRYEAAHNEMYGAAVAAARAGAATMSSGQSAASAAATAAATANKTDGVSLPSADVTITYGYWNSGTSTFSSFGSFTTAQVPAMVNACRVTVTYSVPLTFGSIIGISSKIATETSTAMINVQVDTPTVYATGDIWLANEPAGTHASQADPNYSGLHSNSDHQFPDDVAGTPGKTANGSNNSLANYSISEPYSSPVKIGFNVRPGATIMITNTSGIVSYDHDTSAFVDPTGNSGTTWICDNYRAAALGGSEHGISDATMPIGSLNAVFTGSSAPDSIATPPPSLDFSTAAARNYTVLSPQNQQAFYVGTGKTSSNQQQEIVVPAGATYLFMGVMDAWEWNNNTGTFSCTVTQTYVTTVQ